MIINKTNPVAEDLWIKKLLVSMEGQILPLWTAASSSDCLFYGRTENVDDKDYFYQDGKFKDVYTDRDKMFISFIRTSPDMNFENGQRKILSHLVCQADLAKLYPDISHRADAEIRKDCENVLFKHCELSQYLGHTIVSQSKLKDMQPFHTFELNFYITF